MRDFYKEYSENCYLTIFSIVIPMKCEFVIYQNMGVLALAFWFEISY